MSEHCHDKECHCHEHEHEHEHCHDEHCSCHHEHHNHHDEHGHCHDDHCGCHDHHGHCHEGCACHGGKDSDDIKKDLITAGICAAVFALSFVPVFEPFAFWICLAVTIIAGRETLTEGFRDLMKFHFGEETLMSIAVVAAFIIGEHIEGTMVALLFTIGENLEGLAVDRSKKNIAALADIRPDTANVVCKDDGDIEVVPAENVEIGTEIIIKVGERVPLDCKVLDESVMADASALTGESLPIHIEKGEILKAGCVVLGSPARCETVSGYGDSAAARIIEMVEGAAAKKGATEKFITRFSEIYTPIVIVLAVLVFLVPWAFGWLDFSEAAHRALVFLVSSCPCALVLSIPLAYFAGIGAASKSGVIIKGSEYCERLANVKNAVFDKTGTLTSGRLRVSEILLAGEYSEEEILRYAAAAEALSDHPIAKCVVEEAQNRGIESPAADKASEIAGEGVTVSFGETSVVCGNKKLFDHMGIALPEENGANLYVAVDSVYAGCIFLEDTVREESGEAIAMLKKLGVEHSFMLTGDNEHAAAKIAKECGVEGFYASLMPEDKVDKIEEIKKTGTTVFTGDGINDAPVLAAADIGAAMGMGTDAAIESADIVLMKGGMSALPKAVSIAKKIMACVRQNVIFIMAVKVAVLILGALGYAPIWLAVFADVGVCLLTVLWSLRLLKIKF
ncbi:MAG: cadmium-translocating P-type ATPase [Oscillospiraceae bacterium]|nr:cadmium-translocating P-type ATPase [Oscillospiraceae bacterium]